MPGRDRELLKLTAQIASAFLSRNPSTAASIPDLMRLIYTAAVEIDESGDPKTLPVSLTPAVPVEASVDPSAIACLECGKRLKSLRFHLKTHGLTPEAYRRRWGLPADYPIVAPSLAERRSALAVGARFGKRRKSGSGED